jgi:hypothetical protein
MGTLLTQHLKNLDDFSRLIAVTPQTNDLRPTEHSGETKAALYMGGNPDILTCPKCGRPFSRSLKRCTTCPAAWSPLTLGACSVCGGNGFVNPTGNCLTPLCGYIPPPALPDQVRCPRCKLNLSRTLPMCKTCGAFGPVCPNAHVGNFTAPGECKCGFKPPALGEYRMAKGWGGGGKGIDQIWVKPSNWDPTNVLSPPLQEIVIVEAKGGQIKNVSGAMTTPRYEYEYGVDGTLLEKGCEEMSLDWLYQHAQQLAMLSSGAPELLAIGDFIYKAIVQNQAAPTVVGVVICEGTPLARDELPTDARSRATDTGKIEYRNLGTQSALISIVNTLQALGANPTASAVNTTCNNTVRTLAPDDALFGTGMVLDNQDIAAGKKVYRDSEIADSSKELVRTSFKHLQKSLAKNDRNAINHTGKLINKVKTVNHAVSHRSSRAYLTRTQHRTFEGEMRAANTTAKKKAVREKYFARCLEAAANSVKKDLSELRGEIEATSYIQERGYRLIQGWDSAHTGFDQVWVKSVTTPNFDPAADPWPADAEIVVVEAKGGSAELNDEIVYKHAATSNNTDLGATGCYQMDANWLKTLGWKMYEDAVFNPTRQKVAQKLHAAAGGAGPPPVLKGIVISNGAAITDATELDLEITPGTYAAPDAAGFFQYN